MAPARLLDAQPGERVLDLCAAPGGKTTQLAAAMQGRGLLVCNEIHPRRAQVLASNVERLGIPNALVLSEHPARLAQRFPGYFDRILVDTPCSGEGMFRKEEAAVTDWSEATVAMCAARQQEILASAAEMLAPGGRLVYSTCNTAIFFLKPLLFVENHSCLIWLQNSFYMVFVVCDQLVAFVFFEQFAWDFLICKVACYHQFFVSKRSLICIDIIIIFPAVRGILLPRSLHTGDAAGSVSDSSGKQNPDLQAAVLH